MKRVLTNITLVQPHGEASSDTPVDVTTDAQLHLDGTHVSYAGPKEGAPSIDSDARVEQLGGAAVLPGFVDSHTHVVFGGERIDEMARRSRGETYEAIMAAGGGIRRSQAQLRETPDAEIIQASLSRLSAMKALGTTTVEIKTGYGLTVEGEKRHIALIQQVRQRCEQSSLATLLCHVAPSQHQSSREAFVTALCDEFIAVYAQEPGVHFIDVFIEEGAFTHEEARRLVKAGQSHGLRPKLHVDQLTAGQGAQLAAELKALSADHLETVDDQGRRSLAQTGVVATLLPGCSAFLGGPWPDGRALRDAGCNVAVATDCNPGSSMIKSLPLCGMLAATQCGLSLEEALWGITRGGAKALGLTDRGCLRAGERADYVVLDHDDWRSIFYRADTPPIAQVHTAGD